MITCGWGGGGVENHWEPVGTIENLLKTIDNLWELLKTTDNLGGGGGH